MRLLPERSIHRAIIVVLLIAAFAPFARTLAFGNVMDDTTVIRANAVRQGWGSRLKVWTQPYFGLRDSGLDRPLLMVLFAFVWNAGGHWPLWFHAVCVAMHMTATLLVWRLLRSGVSRWPAVLGALWFAVHPVHVEAVANIANSSEVFVGLWTCALALWLARIDENPGRIPWTRATVAGALYLAAFLTKESGAVAPMLAALWLWGWHKASETRTPRSFAQLVARWRPVLVAWGAAALIVIVARHFVLGGPVSEASIAPSGLYELSASQRAWAMFSLGPTILRLLIWPGPPTPYYGPSVLAQPGAATWATLTIVTVLAVLSVGAWLAKRGDRRVLAAVAWILVAFLPASNLLVATGQILSERTLYVPSIGIAMLIGLALQAVWSISGRMPALRVLRTAAIAASAAIATMLAVRTARAIEVWRDHSTLFAQMIRSESGAYRGYWLLGLEDRRRGRRSSAIEMFDRAYTEYPGDPGLLMDFSITLYEQGDYRRAASVGAGLMRWPHLRAHPTWVSLYLDALGRAYGPDSVIAVGGRLMGEAPSPKTALFVGFAHETRGDLAGAVRNYGAGLRLSPSDSALRDRLAKVQARSR
jgi:tetratricopeptide (TPR) repeat protein